MKRKPVLEVRIRDFYVKTTAFLSNVVSGFKPGFEAVPVNLILDCFLNLKPRIRFLFTFHSRGLDFHRFFHTCGKPSDLLNMNYKEGSDIIALRIDNFKK